MTTITFPGGKFLKFVHAFLFIALLEHLRLERLARGFISRFRVGDANNIMGIIPYSYENDSAYLLEYVYSAIAVLKRKAYVGVLYKSWTIY